MNIEQRTREYLQRNAIAQPVQVPEGLAGRVKAGQRRRDIRVTATALAAATAVVAGGAWGLSYGLGQNTSTKIQTADQPTTTPTLPSATTTGTMISTTTPTVAGTATGKQTRGASVTPTVGLGPAGGTASGTATTALAGGATVIDLSGYEGAWIGYPGAGTGTSSQGCALDSSSLECTVTGRELTHEEKLRFCDFDGDGQSVQVDDLSHWVCRGDPTVIWRSGPMKSHADDMYSSQRTQWYFDLKPKGFDPNANRPLLLPGMTLKMGKFTLTNDGGAIVGRNTATGASFTIRGKQVDFKKMRPENPPGFKFEN